MTLHNARAEALSILAAVEQGGRFAEELLADRLPTVAEKDRPLVTSLVYGAVRHRLTLDTIARAFSVSGKPVKPAPLAEVVRLGVYQLVFLDRIPAHAAIHETVELAKSQSAKAVGFVNAVLRAVAANLAKSEKAGEPRRTLVRPDGMSAVFTHDVFPADEVGRLATTTSHPRWLVERWLHAYGDRAEAICRAGNAALPLTLRATGDRDALAFDVAGVPGAAPESVRLERGSPAQLPGFAEGRFIVQDETAMRVAPLLRGALRVADLCAGAGVKATHLAALGARVLAMDRSRAQIARLRQNVARLTSDVAVVRGDALRPPVRGVDAILLDAPCSNTGVLARRPEARWRLTEEKLSDFGRVQRRMLVTSLARAPRVLYVTCSIEREENEEVVQDAVRGKNLKVVDTRLTLPSATCGGGFYALIHSA